MSTNIKWIPLGENCLAYGILKRIGKNNIIVSPFASCRSNIDHVIGLEQMDYENLLNKDYLQLNENAVLINTLMSCDNIFYCSSNGFEFTHSNPLESETDRNSMLRKIDRMLSLRNDMDKKVFLYHHRINPNTDIPRLVAKSKQFVDNYVNAVFVVFYQKIVTDKRARKIIMEQYENVLVFKFETLQLWSGADQHVFWARCDNDLILKMIKKIVLLLTVIV